MKRRESGVLKQEYKGSLATEICIQFNSTCTIQDDRQLPRASFCPRGPGATLGRVFQFYKRWNAPDTPTIVDRVACVNPC